MKSLLLPLDERPCNLYFPQLLAATSDSLNLIVPEKKMLGDKRKGADLTEIRSFLMNHTDVDAMVISMDMLLYGGLLPSRIHHASMEELKKRLDVIREVKKANPELRIYAFQCIMRCPQYNSGEEEPEYYEQYGYRIFRSAYLKDKKKRTGISDAEEKELSEISVPAEILSDYEHRREINRNMNLETLKLLKEGVIDFLVIPQDDSAPYGYTAMDQKKVLAEIHAEHLEYRTMVYPGADEVGMSLLARAYNAYYHRKPLIYPFYASVLGPQIVPLYEDRPMLESMKSHIRVTGGQMVLSPEQATHIVAVNSPGKVMQESFDAEKDITYTSYRNLPAFVDEIRYYVEQGKKVGLCDSAFANGGDLELIHALDHEDLLDRLYGYAGWNTNCNTTGTVLSLLEISEKCPVENTIYRIIEDVFYQADVRMDTVNHDLKELGLGYYDFKDQQEEVEKRIAHKLMKRYNTLSLAAKYPVDEIRVLMPWRRMFEIGMQIRFAKDR